MEQSKTAQATTNSYASLLKVKAPDFESVTLVVTNSHAANALTLQILVSNDPQGSTVSYAPMVLEYDPNAAEIPPIQSGTREIEVTAQGSATFNLPLYHWFDVQVKSASAGNAATANAWLNAR